MEIVDLARVIEFVCYFCLPIGMRAAQGAKIAHFQQGIIAIAVAILGLAILANLDSLNSVFPLISMAQRPITLKSQVLLSTIVRDFRKFPAIF